MFIVEHHHDTDGGFGDAISQCDIVACFAKKEEAESWAEKYSNEHVYYIPHDSLWCGKLTVSELKEFSTPESEMWWMDDEEENEEGLD